MSSFLALFATGVLAFLTLLTWPVRAVIIYFKRRKLRGRGQVKRVVVLGLDGLDPELTRRYMDEGRLPHFQTLAKSGSFFPLRTTTPSISPVAWSTFSTGVNPGKHRIFDFFTRDPGNYQPVLSSVRISTAKETIGFGPLKIPVRRNRTQFLRKSTSFWKILGETGIFSSVLRVPITFPPEKFYGASLSAMCVPDLLGTQGTFSFYTTDDANSSGQTTGGVRIPLRINNGRFETYIQGPAMDGKATSTPLRIPVQGSLDTANKTVTLHIGKETITLAKNQYSPWVKLVFKAGLRKRLHGIARFLLTETKPHVKIYMTPINIDPEKPSMPISHPFFYSVILAKLHGAFATLGLAEDTWALNEQVIDESAFLEQTYDIYEARKAHLLDTLNKQEEGLVVMVFDTTDRIQHMFFRYLCPDHPANKDKDTQIHKDAIANVYEKMDDLVGEINTMLNWDDLLIVISDHGFKPFKWGINLNTWLWKEGYLVLKDGAEPGKEWFAGVDWRKTRAFAYGLSGIFLNVKGREKQGVVERGSQRTGLQLEIKHKLESLIDPRTGQRPIRRVILAEQAAKGPYLEDAHDLFIGYEEGYRVSWNSAIGKISEEVFEDNTRSWSGDHSIDPELVPGVFFSNWKLLDKDPHIADVGPSILHLFGVEKRAFHDGRVLQLVKFSGAQGEETTP